MGGIGAPQVVQGLVAGFVHLLWSRAGRRLWRVVLREDPRVRVAIDELNAVLGRGGDVIRQDTSPSGQGMRPVVASVPSLISRGTPPGPRGASAGAPVQHQRI